MKKNAIFTLILVALLCAVALCACSKTDALPRPKGFKYDRDSHELQWSAVTFATGYEVEVTGTDEEGVAYNQTSTTTRAYFSLSNLNAGVYKVRLRALGDKVNYKDSSWVGPLDVIKVYESGLSYRLINSNTEYEVYNVGYAIETAGSGDLVIDSVYRDKPVTSIAKSAFFNCSGLTSIVIPDSVTKIGDKAFQNCSYLQSVTLPSTLKTIGASAFRNCRSLTEITIPDTVTDIEESTFSYCRGLTQVSLGKGVKTIGQSAFLACNALKTIELGNNVENVSISAFEDCDALTDVTIGNGIKRISMDAFRNCDALTRVKLGSGLEAIGEYAFSDCVQLSAIVIPDSVTEIGTGAFYGCEQLSDISIGASVKKIGRFAFENTVAWTQAMVDNDSIAGNDNNKVIYIDNWALGCETFASPYPNISLVDGTVGVGNSAFYVETTSSNTTGSKLASVTLPQSVKYIDDYAFYGCKSLSDVTITNAVSIGDYAFAYCQSLMSLTFGNGDTDSCQLESIGNCAFAGCRYFGAGLQLPSSVKHIGAYAFDGTRVYDNADVVMVVDDWIVGVNDAKLLAADLRDLEIVGIADEAFFDCEILLEILLPDTLRYVGRAAFAYCTCLLYVDLPEGVTKVDDYAFYNCISLMSANMPTVDTIGDYAFTNCEYLEEVNTASDLVSIGDYAFYGCSFLEQLDLGSVLEKIGYCAFYASGLTSLNVPGTVLEVGDYAFARCVNLEIAMINEGVTAIGKYAFNNCESLVRVTLPSTMKTIGDYAFRNCSSLRAIDLGGVVEIGNYAFVNCTSLQHVVIPNTVTSIGKHAFRGSSSLQSVVISDKVDAMGLHVFYGCSDLTIYVQASELPSGWMPRWNSSYRPVFWAVTTDESQSYVVSIVTGKLDNANNSISSPYREGYTFGGWSVTAGGKVYDTGNLAEVAEGTTLYAIWIPN